MLLFLLLDGLFAPLPLMHMHDACMPHFSGYACSMHNLVNSWRQQWSLTKGTTSATFPFGIVSLAAGTSEGHTYNMPNFRHAQVWLSASDPILTVCTVWHITL